MTKVVEEVAERRFRCLLLIFCFDRREYFVVDLC